MCVCAIYINVQFFYNVSPGLDKSISLVGNLGKHQDIVKLTVPNVKVPLQIRMRKA